MLGIIIGVVIVVYIVGNWALMKASGECSRLEEREEVCRHQATKKCRNQCCYFCFAVAECSKKCLLNPRNCGKEVKIHGTADK